MMRERLAVLVCALAASACGPAAPAPAPPRATTSSSGGEGQGNDVSITRRDEPAPALTDDASRAGEAVFTRACAPCHSADTFGGSLASRRLPVERVRASLHAGSDGEGLLPVVPPALLSQADVAPLMAYLRAIGASQ